MNFYHDNIYQTSLGMINNTVSDTLLVYGETTMSVKVTFNTPEERAAFALKYNLEAPLTAGVNSVSSELSIPWHLLAHAKKSAGASLEQEDTTTQQFIVAGDPTELAKHGTLVKELGGGFYLVESAAGVNLAGASTSFDITSTPMQFLANVGSINGMSNDATSLLPTSPEGQWARIRVASRYRPLITSFALYDVTYLSVPELYVMDTGIDFDHPEFDVPTLQKENFYTLPAFNGSFTDDVGHGTAVASMAVGKNLGTAVQCKLISVKVGGATYNANLLDISTAIDAIIARAATDPMISRIVNMSWGISRSDWLDHKVQLLLDAGITVVCAAGNQKISVEDISPAGMNDVITVASIDKYDIPSGFNNISPTDSGLTTAYGLSIDMFAPGDNVLVASINPDAPYEVASGTSFSSPLVAGVATVIASLNATPIFYQDLKKVLIDTATQHAILFEDDTYNEEQNRISYLFTADPNAAYLNDNVASYLGVMAGTNPNETIVADLNSSLGLTTFTTLFPDDAFTYSIKFADPAQGLLYGPFFVVNPVTGVLTITQPVVQMDAAETLRMVTVVGVAQSSRVTIKTNNLFIFVANPLHSHTLTSDITLALTETNSISFYAKWNLQIK